YFRRLPVLAEKSPLDVQFVNPASPAIFAVIRCASSTEGPTALVHENRGVEQHRSVKTDDISLVAPPCLNSSLSPRTVQVRETRLQALSERAIAVSTSGPKPKW